MKVPLKISGFHPRTDELEPHCTSYKIVPCESIAEEVSFEGYQYRIPSRDSGVKELGHMYLQRTWKAGRYKGINVTLEAFLSYIFIYPFHTHDVTAAILVSQTNETAAMLMLKTNPLGVELFSNVNAFFCCN